MNKRVFSVCFQERRIGNCFFDRVELTDADQFAVVVLVEEGPILLPASLGRSRYMAQDIL
jgi:hypothetical protein